jgi:predicted DsbA family dithiol-disulfide isomerase
LFVAYFTNGEDIGNHIVLDRIAQDAGMQPGALDRSLPSLAEILQLDDSLRTVGVNSVPSYIVDRKLMFSGSNTVDGYVRTLTDAASRVN